MAWAEKLPSGRYRGVYRDSRGRKRSLGKSYKHKAEAQRAAAAEEERARKRVAADAQGWRRTWGEWADEWLPTRDVEPSTAKADGYRLDRHLRPRWGDVQLGAITRQSIKAWVATMRRKGVSPANVQRIVRLLSVSLAAAVDAEVIESNPAAGLKLKGGEQAGERFLTRDEYAAIRAELPTTDHQLVADVLVYTGMRWGEMAGLHHNRLSLTKGEVHIVEAWQDASGMIKPYPKGKRGRVVPLPASLVARLAEVPVRIGGCPVPHAVGKCRSGLVLTTERGSVLRNSNWGEDWRAACERAGVHARIHDLRHTYASWLLQGGVPLAEVGQLLGHVSPATTARYARLAAKPSDKVLSALDAPDLPHGGKAETLG